jgi:hypothetical protein
MKRMNPSEAFESVYDPSLRQGPERSPIADLIPAKFPRRIKNAQEFTYAF